MSVFRQFAVLVLCAGASLSTSAGVFPVDTTGVYLPSTGQWLLRNSNTAGDPHLVVKFGGLPGDLPVAGDWDGDGTSDFGIFRNGTFLRARFRPAEPACPICPDPPDLEQLDSIVFGQAGDLPVAGDWNGDGIDDVGIYRPGEQGTFLLRVATVFQFCTFCPPRTVVTVETVILGTTGNVPIAADWDGDGLDDVGLFDPPAAVFVLSLDRAKPTFSFFFGLPRNRPLAGDWLGSGRAGIGVFESAVPTMILAADVADVQIDLAFSLGVPSEGLPVAGRWPVVP